MDYVKFARAKGLYGVARDLRPCVQEHPDSAGDRDRLAARHGVFAFAVVTESIFAWPGMGKLIIDLINMLDRPVIVAYLLVTVSLFVLINLVVDLLYSVLDPRVRLSEMKD